MDILDRYLQAVKFFLPRSQQDDIIRELSENLLARMQDREEELGRPLDEAEQAAILREHGHPLLVAGRYRTRQQLIGPTFFPLYILALNMGLGIALLVSIVLGVVHGRALRRSLSASSRNRAQVSGPRIDGVRVDDARICRTGLRIHAHSRGARLGSPKAPESDQRGATDSAAEDTVGAGLHADLCCMAAVAATIAMAGARFRSPHSCSTAPVWRVVYVPMLLLALGTAGLHVIDFVHPYRTRTRELIRVTIGVGSLFVFMFLARAGDLFLPRAAAALPEGLDVTRVMDVVNASFRIGFAVAAAITVFEIWRGLRRMKQWRGTTMSSDSAHARAGR